MARPADPARQVPLQDHDEGGGADRAADTLHDGELRCGVDDLGGSQIPHGRRHGGSTQQAGEGADALVLADPRPARLLVRRGLTGSGSATDYLDGSATVDADLENLTRAQERGEISPGIDPAFIRMALMGMILAPVMLPETALQATGKQPGSPEFEEYYSAQLRKLIRLLGR
ncbi:hypothetical protein ACFXG4_10330 [Nocardia sp. NPDC059246]|uniref:hypothetical protein n=1 Tax=unclassified Nocardia TaxID=2637762 RepID=UPI0036919B38